MEQSQEKREQKKKQNSEGNNLIWDCGSTLYDSFEFNAFNRQLNSAIVHSRTMSMPHLVHCAPPPPPPSKLSRSIEKLLKSTFKFRPICSCSSVLLPEKKIEQRALRCLRQDRHSEIREVSDVDFGGFCSTQIINSWVIKL
ncbi:hypothetical protein ES288_D11G025800v1 [Gossypium darwinii]|uniref:Uncharacterized protein n=2 Tax=Gossypium TaxID=3633 RepID=A0A5D2IIT2_GOSTO|nr:hypothetical protein ES288_D11G025800v1 [Gossypium darwinii]TYH41886.1 hypothetical protein ES332_D11G025100v1 [Gossypium tomentosum]